MTTPVRHLVIFLILGACASRTAFAQPAAADEPRPKVTIYGTIVANTSASDHQLFQSDVPLWALLDAQRLVPASIGSQQPGSVDAASVSAFEATARQTRLGFRIDVPAGKSHWTPTGRIEVDFFGARPAVTSGAVFNLKFPLLNP